jgi:hypothetical protein
MERVQIHSDRGIRLLAHTEKGAKEISFSYVTIDEGYPAW